jgi:hypothetical protein
MKNKGFWVAAALSVGLLQTWDSGAFAGEGWIAALALVAVLAPVASIAVDAGQGVRILALVFGAVLLVLARVGSPEPLNAVHLALLPAALYILVVQGLPQGTANKGIGR